MSRQLAALTAQIHAMRTPALLVSVDHEGGRVQRFREGFTAIPPMRTLGDMWQRDAAAAALEARRVGGVIARELRAHGVDFSFTPGARRRLRHQRGDRRSRVLR
jgi:beta-N-acetylhexosaminidase